MTMNCHIPQLQLRFIYYSATVLLRNVAGRRLLAYTGRLCLVCVTALLVCALTLIHWYTGTFTE